MDVNELTASLQRIMDEQQPPAAPAPVVPEDYTALQPPVEADTPAAYEDPAFARFYTPEPVQQTELHEPYVEHVIYEFDELPEDQEDAGEVKVTNVANATYRAKRTGFQGLLAAILIAVGGVLTSLQVDSEIDWKLLGFACGQAVLTAVVSFLHNDKAASADSE